MFYSNSKVNKVTYAAQCYVRTQEIFIHGMREGMQYSLAGQ
jgi:hypothetical protein